MPGSEGSKFINFDNMYKDRDINSIDQYGYTDLFRAIENLNFNLVHHLVKHGANIYQPQYLVRNDYFNNTQVKDDIYQDSFILKFALEYSPKAFAIMVKNSNYPVIKGYIDRAINIQDQAIHKLLYVAAFVFESIEYIAMCDQIISNGLPCLNFSRSEFNETLEISEKLNKQLSTVLKEYLIALVDDLGIPDVLKYIDQNKHLEVTLNNLNYLANKLLNNKEFTKLFICQNKGKLINGAFILQKLNYLIKKTKNESIGILNYYVPVTNDTDEIEEDNYLISQQNWDFTQKFWLYCQYQTTLMEQEKIKAFTIQAALPNHKISIQPEEINQELLRLFRFKSI